MLQHLYKILDKISYKIFGIRSPENIPRPKTNIGIGFSQGYHIPFKLRNYIPETEMIAPIEELVNAIIENTEKLEDLKEGDYPIITSHTYIDDTLVIHFVEKPPENLIEKIKKNIREYNKNILEQNPFFKKQEKAYKKFLKPI